VSKRFDVLDSKMDAMQQTLAAHGKFLGTLVGGENEIPSLVRALSHGSRAALSRLSNGSRTALSRLSHGSRTALERLSNGSLTARAGVDL
jgi:hypothetical protein